MKNLALIGYGRIGQAIKYYLEKNLYTVDAYDIHPHPDCTVFLGQQMDSSVYQYHLQRYDGVICATPYHMNETVAAAAINLGIAYFDLTEDVRIANDINKMVTMKQKYSVAQATIGIPSVSTQCGLAPGAVSMIAAQMATTFDEVVDVNLRVGALPLTANNKIKYYLTWSSEGLVNEYCNPCPAVVDGKQLDLQPLEGLEEIVIDGDEYEAFNTSGGIGTLIQTLEKMGKQAHNINYKTIRYKGHRDLMCFLLDDLGLRSDKQTLVNIFNRQVPQVRNDVVVIFVQVTGYRNGKFTAETYCRKIRGEGDFTAIQRTTALGLCTVVHHWAQGKFQPGVNVPESIPLGDLRSNPFWSVYHFDPNNNIVDYLL